MSKSEQKRVCKQSECYFRAELEKQVQEQFAEMVNMLDQIADLKADLSIYVTNFEYNKNYKKGGLIEGWFDTNIIKNSRRLLDKQ